MAAPPARIAARVALAGLIVLLVVDLVIAIAHPDMHGDTEGLARGAKGAVQCLEDHRFTSCDVLAHGPRYVGQWPLLQYVPAMAMRAVGVSQELTLRVLIVVEALAVDGLLLLAWFSVRRKAGAMWALVVVAALISGPLLWYETSAFGEALAAAMVLAAIVAVLHGARPGVIAALVAVASISKETSPPFVFVIAVLCVLAVGEVAQRRRALIAIAIGTAAGIAANTAFNVFRYGSIRNKLYLESYLQVPDNHTAVRFFGALVAAPNGGLVWFWPASLAIIGFVTLVSLWRAGKARRLRWDTAAGPIIAGLLLIELGGLARWFSPFGWIAWGSRLTIPLMPAMLVASVVCSAGFTTAPIGRFLTSAWFWIVAIAMTLLAIPQAAVVFQPHVLEKFFAQAPPCVNAHINTSVPRYFKCVDYLMWRKHPLLLARGLEGFATNGGRLVVAALVVAMMGLLVAARQLAADTDVQPPTPAPVASASS